ncbi:MAG: tyrosine-type recombinase/integrase [Candidatus Nitrosopumilus sp. bin_6a]
MSYLDTRITREQFINTRGAEKTQLGTQSSLNLFDRFCEASYKEDGDVVVRNLESAIKKDGNYDRLFMICNNFVIWLLEDHPEIIVKRNHYTTTVKKHNPSSIKKTIHVLRQYFEEFGHLEFSERKFRRMVRLPKKIDEDPEPFTKAEIRQFVDNAMPKRKALYMTLKDSGLRIGEAVQLRKRDIDITTNPVTLTIPATYTKTKKGRISFVTRETKPFLERIMSELDDDDRVFGVNDSKRRSVVNEEVCWIRVRDKLGFTDRYESNGRHKKNMHSLRAYCATQLAEVYGEEFAHGFIGHKGYLKQYIRNKDKLAEKYLRAENSLMIYESVEVVEQTDKVEQLELQNLKMQKAIQELQNLHKLKEQTESEIKKLELMR